MTKQYDDAFDAVLSGVVPEREKRSVRGGAWFRRRGNTISERLVGETEEKVLHWVEPARCRMWARHNRDYGLLTEENCRDLIDGIRAQGRQEFPAIVRRINGEAHEFEVICGARRHFAISWLRANDHAHLNYLVEVRDLTDEEAFRLSDIENRDRQDISDYERALDYAAAVKLYYGGKQKAMAERLEVTEVWLSRYLDLARLPDAIVQAFPTVSDIRELHARRLKPFLKVPADKEAVLKAAAGLAEQQSKARKGQGAFVPVNTVMSTLKAAIVQPKPRKKTKVQQFRGSAGGIITCSRHGRKLRLEFDGNMSREDVETAFNAFLKDRF